MAEGATPGLASVLLFLYGLTGRAFSDELPSEVIKHRLSAGSQRFLGPNMDRILHRTS